MIVTTPLVVAALIGFLQIGPAPQPAPVTVRNEITVSAPPPDPEAIAEASVQSGQAIVVQLVAPTLVRWANDAINMADIFRTTPPEWTYQNSVIRGLATQVAVAAGALLALFVVIAAFGHMLGQGMGYGRVLYGAVASIFNLLWWELGITLNNVICAAIAAPSMTDIVRPNLNLPALTANPIEAFGPSVIVIVYAIVALMLVLSLVFRLAMIDVLIVLGSLALLTKATEQTDTWSTRYQTLAAGTLFSQILIVVCLRLAPVLGGIGTGFVGSVLGIAVLLLARRMPSILATGHAQRAGGGIGVGTMLLARRLLAKV